MCLGENMGKASKTAEIPSLSQALNHNKLRRPPAVPGNNKFWVGLNNKPRPHNTLWSLTL